MTNATRVRPRFKFQSSQHPEEIIQNMRKYSPAGAVVEAEFMQHHIYLRIPQKDQQYWSPELHLTLEPNDKGTLVRGIVGPKPKVWTMYMFFYSGVIVLLMFGSAMGISQWMLGLDAPWLWSIPASGLLGLLIFAAAKIGQKMASAQTLRLKNFMKQLLQMDGHTLQDA